MYMDGNVINQILYLTQVYYLIHVFDISFCQYHPYEYIHSHTSTFYNGVYLIVEVLNRIYLPLSFYRRHCLCIRCFLKEVYAMHNE